MNSTEHNQQKTACEKLSYRVTKKDLPLSCPMPDMILWNAHPKVYLPIEETGHELCPYCGAEYHLENSQS